MNCVCQIAQEKVLLMALHHLNFSFASPIWWWDFSPAYAISKTLCLLQKAGRVRKNTFFLLAYFYSKHYRHLPAIHGNERKGQLTATLSVLKKVQQLLTKIQKSITFRKLNYQLIKWLTRTPGFWCFLHSCHHSCNPRQEKNIHAPSFSFLLRVLKNTCCLLEGISAR